MSDVKENPDAGEEDDEARAAVREERERDAGERRASHHGEDVHRGLPADEHREPGGEALPERVLAAQRDVEARYKLYEYLAQRRTKPEPAAAD